MRVGALVSVGINQHRSARSQVAVRDAAEAVIIRRSYPPPLQPADPTVILRPARRYDLSAVFRVLEGVEWLQALVDENAQGEQRRASNPVPAMDQHLITPADPIHDEGNAVIKVIRDR